VANLIDGKKVASDIKEEVKSAVIALAERKIRPPCLAVVLVGDDEASKVYVGHKERACQSVGIRSLSYRLPKETTREQLADTLRKLNDDSNVDGILLQLPLPPHLNKEEMIDLISPAKDVDGLNPVNQGLLASQRDGIFPCTPLGVIKLIKSTGQTIQGKVAVVVGRSLLVGSPVAQMLTHEGASVIMLHSKSVNPAELASQGDILVVATGVHHLVNRKWVKEGAVVIDVGMHRRDGKLSGDVNFDDVKDVAGYITPVPGGVGPMTIAMLLVNCLKAHAKTFKLL
jgi:methylenetetrahydrofolate dehydrogenase (NADP+)/methenyltetrahydrofolate cyclohydrolase